MKAVVDKIEASWIVFASEAEEIFDVPFDYSPDAEEGDLVTITIVKDMGSKKEAEERIFDLEVS